MHANLDTIPASGDIVLLITDRPDGSRELAAALGSAWTCRTVRLNDTVSRPPRAAAVVVDVCFRGLVEIERLRELLSTFGRTTSPVLALLRDRSRLAKVQAVALGATATVDAEAPAVEVCVALVRALGLLTPTGTPADSTPEQNIEHARLAFAGIFSAAARGQPVSMEDADVGTTAVVDAITEGGIRKWLDVVWRYHDATYQHCMLVTGLAAEFAACLSFSPNDQHHLSRGALLHDIGKARIPLAILNKPGRLNPEETAIMRAHPRIGYDMLRRQGDCEPEILEVVLRHHELLDGTGYPDGIAGTKITDLVRLVTICDIYGALIERRSYKQPMDPVEAFRIVRSMEGKLEGALVRAFEPIAEKSATAAPVEEAG
jgi:putative nucleotidyltransferase with HDIG domain